MLIKNTFSVSASHIHLMSKILIYFFFIMLIFLALATALILPLINELGAVLQQNESFNITSKIVDSTQSFDFSTFISKLGKDVALFFSDSSGEVVFTGLMFCLLLFFVKFLTALAYLPCSKLIGGQMTTGFTDKFSRVFITCLSQSLLYALISSLVFLFIDLPIVALCVYLTALLAGSLKVFAITLTLALMIVLLSIRLALLSQWLPRIALGNEKVFSAFLATIIDVPNTFRKSFLGMLSLLILAFLTVLTTIVPTMFLSVLVVIPAVIVIYMSMTNILWCNKNSQNYFVDEATVIDVKKIESEHEEIN